MIDYRFVSFAHRTVTPHAVKKADNSKESSEDTNRTCHNIKQGTVCHLFPLRLDRASTIGPSSQFPFDNLLGDADRRDLAACLRDNFVHLGLHFGGQRYEVEAETRCQSASYLLSKNCVERRSCENETSGR